MRGWVWGVQTGCRLSGCLMVINEFVCRQVSQNNADKKPGEFYKRDVVVLPVFVDTLLPPGAQWTSVVCKHTHHTCHFIPVSFDVFKVTICCRLRCSVVSLHKQADWPRLVTQLFDPTNLISDLKFLHVFSTLDWWTGGLCCVNCRLNTNNLDFMTNVSLQGKMERRRRRAVKTRNHQTGQWKCFKNGVWEIKAGTTDCILTVLRGETI